MSGDGAGGGSRARAAIEDVGALVGVGYIGQIATFVLSIVLRRILGPSDVAWVAMLGLAAAYAPYLGLGALQAAERLIALEIGRGDSRAALDIEAAAAAIVGAISLVVVVVAILALVSMDTGPDGRRALEAAVVTVIIQQVAALAIIRLRTRLRFRAVAFTALATAILTSGGAVLGAVVAHLPGAIAGTVLGYVLGAALLAWVGGLELRRVRMDALRRVLAGAPSFLALGATTILLYTLDQVIAGAALGAAAFGLYTTAYLGNAFLVRIPANISAALYPRLQISFGGGSDPPFLARQAWRATILSVTVVGPLVGAAIIGLPLALRVVLPAYAAAIPSMRLVLLAVMGLLLAGPASQLLVSLGRQWVVMAVTALAAAVILAGSGVAAATHVIDIQTIALVDCARIPWVRNRHPACDRHYGTRAPVPDGPGRCRCVRPADLRRHRSVVAGWVGGGRSDQAGRFGDRRRDGFPDRLGVGTHRDLAIQQRAALRPSDPAGGVGARSPCHHSGASARCLTTSSKWRSASPATQKPEMNVPT